MKFLLLDDHQLFLEGFKNILLKQFTDADIFTASQVDVALQIIKEHQNIDLVLVDLSMPNYGGLEFIKALKQDAIFIPTVVLSASENIEEINACLHAGAQGFIPKYYDVPSMLRAISTVNSGKLYLPENIKQGIAQQVYQERKIQETIEIYDITARQLEVLALINKGFANNKIADILYISEHTVKSHLKLIFKSLKVSNRVECIHKAKELGML